MSERELRALIARQEAALHGVLPEDVHCRLVLLLAATAELAERAHSDEHNRPTIH